MISKSVLHLTADFLSIFHALLCRNNGNDRLKNVHSNHKDNCILYISHNVRCSLQLKMFSPVVNCIHHPQCEMFITVGRFFLLL